MRRWTGLLLAMMLLFLSGCGDAAESSSPESQDGEAGASALLQFELPQEGDEIVVIHTSMGTLKVMLFPEVAPKAVENFVTHAKEGYYNGLKFYKVQKKHHFRYQATNSQMFYDNLNPFHKHTL